MKFLSNIGKNAVKIGYGIAGGAAGRIATKNLATKIPYIKDKPKLQPALALLAGAALMDGKGDLMHYGGHGMATVAGVDALGNFVPALAYTEAVSDDMADEVADILEERLSDDVGDAESAMNDDVTNTGAAMNDEVGDDMNDDMNDDLNGWDD